MSGLQGYRGKGLDLLSKHHLSIGDSVRLYFEGQSCDGSLLPRYEGADENHVVIKLSNGYNLGINVSKILKIEKLSPLAEPKPLIMEESEANESLPRVAILGTGGTIACKIDYRTGGVYPAMTAREIYMAVPELTKIARMEVEAVMNIGSANMVPENWSRLSERVAAKIEEGFEGIVIAHGTDTMAYTAAALSFAVQSPPIPIVMVGAQRSTDRPSSDAAINLISAMTVASQAQFAGVYIAMHSNMNDGEGVVLIGSKARKNHTSRRDAFEPVNIPPAAFVRNGKIEQNMTLPPRRNDGKATLKKEFESKVALLKIHPGFNAEVIDLLVEKGYRGLVIEGTGLGHVGDYLLGPIGKAVKNGVLVGMTSQCIWGRVNLKVYNTGRDLLALGVLPLKDLLPETALVKTMWALGNTSNAEEAKRLLTTGIAGEFSDRSAFERRPMA